MPIDKWNSIMTKIVLCQRVSMGNRKNINGSQEARLDNIGQLKIKICLEFNCLISKSIMQKKTRKWVGCQIVSLTNINPNHQADSITIIYIMECRAIKWKKYYTLMVQTTFNNLILIIATNQYVNLLHYILKHPFLHHYLQKRYTKMFQINLT